MILLRLITWPYVRKHLLRSVLTTAGIVLGVALLVGMQTANRSELRAFNRTVDRIAGKAQLQVSAGDSGFAEEVLERLQSLPEVRAAAPVIESSVDPGLKGQGKLLILAVDMTGDRTLRDYDFDSGEQEVIDDPLVFLAQPDSLIVTREFADRNSLRSGSKIAFDTMEGRKQFTVRGILKAGGMAQAFGGNLGIMDIYAAQKFFGRGRRFDRIDIGLAEGVSLDRGVAALSQLLGPAFTVEPPSGRGRQFESLLGIYSLAMSISSMFALFIGMFIIYNSFAIAVTQRRPEIGILRALGATRGQIRTLFLAESAGAGVIGSAVGVGLGLAFARSLTGVTGRMMEQILGVPQNAQEVLVDPWFLAAAMAVGVLTSVIAAFIPARSAARVEPVQALQKGRYQVLAAGENRMRRNAALACALVSVVCLAFSAYRPAFYLGYLLTVLAGLLLTPLLSLLLARLLRYPMKWLRPVEGALAADSLIQAPRRTSATVAALMLSLALVIGQGGVARAAFDSIAEWTHTTLNPDLFVSASETLAARDFHFPAAMYADLEKIPGIADIQPVRTARVQFRGKPVMIIAVELEKVARRVHRIPVAGDPNTMNRLAAQEKGVLIGDNLAILEKLKLGDPIDLATPAGPLRLPVVGIIRDYSNQLGAIFLERKAYIRYFQDDTVDLFRVYVKPGVRVDDVRRDIVDRLGSRRRMFVLLNQDVRDYVLGLTNQWLGMTYLQVLVAVLVAVLGIVNTLTVSIADRRQELGVLRAVGGLRSQIRGTVWMEAAAIGFIGLVLGIATGAINLYYELQAIQQDLTGMSLAYQFPFGIVAILVPVILLAALGAAVLPAESAVRGSLVEALEYE
ncbi:MAG: FtsX-like permease family protein [Candidatus Solibacter sp.]|jgi:putative ABC transport system permease protein